jgi:hypothetical protein
MIYFSNHRRRASRPSTIRMPSAEPIGDVAQPGLHHGTGPIPTPTPEQALTAWIESHTGPCRNACLDVFDGVCIDADICGNQDARPYDVITCADQMLTCAEAWSAARRDPTGLSLCWRSCEGLH